MPEVGSCFAGIAGLDRGLRRAGLSTRWMCEIDRHCRTVLVRDFPETEVIYGDIRILSGAAAAPVDVLCGAFPCQDLSIAGKRAGLGGARSGLFHEFMRIVREMRRETGGRSPAFVVIENVPGLLSSARGADFGVLLDALAQLGALDIAWRVLDSQFFGVAQRRRRVFVVADFAGERAAEVLALREGLSGHPAPRRTAGQGVAPGAPDGAGSGRVFSNRCGVSGDVTETLRADSHGAQPSGARHDCLAVDNRSGTLGDIAHTMQAKANGGFSQNSTPHVLTGTMVGNGDAHSGFRMGDGQTVTHALTGEGHDASEDGTGRGTPRAAYGIRGTIASRSVEKGGPGGTGIVRGVQCPLNATEEHAVAYPIQNDTYSRSGDTSEGIKMPSLGVGIEGEPMFTLDTTKPHAIAMRQRTRPDGRNVEMQDGLAYALQAGGGGDTNGQHVVLPMAVRRLTPVECERLQGFPDHATAGFADSVRYRMLGNAITETVGFWIGQGLMRAFALGERAGAVPR